MIHCIITILYFEKLFYIVTTKIQYKMSYVIIYEYYQNVKEFIAPCYGASENCRVFCYAKLISAKFTHFRLVD